MKHRTMNYRNRKSYDNNINIDNSDRTVKKLIDRDWFNAKWTDIYNYERDWFDKNWIHRYKFNKR